MISTSKYYYGCYFLCRSSKNYTYNRRDFINDRSSNNSGDESYSNRNKNES